MSHEAELATERLHRASERVLANEVEMDILLAVDHARERPKKREVILDLIQAGHMEQPPWRRVFRTRCPVSPEIDAERNDLHAHSPRRGEALHELGAHRDSRGEPGGQAH